MTLFALPFAGFATWAGLKIITALWLAHAAQSWQPVNARVLSAQVVSRGDYKSTTWEAKARYEYVVDATSYVSERIGVHSGGDNLDESAHRIVDELKTSQRTGRPVIAWVNPGRPSEAILRREIRWNLVGLQGIFALAFGLIGFGLIAATLVAVRRDRRVDELALRFPGQPWRLRPDWAEGRALGEDGSEAAERTVMAVLWNLVSAPLIWLVPRELARKNYPAVVGVLFPLSGIWLAFSAAKRVGRWRRLRRSALVLETLPGVVGGKLRGRIETSLPLPPSGELTLTLTCIRRRRLGGRSGWAEDVLQREGQVLPPSAISRRLEGATIQVEFEIPAGAPASTPRAPPERVLWRLEARAKPGFEARFEVPVFVS
jgi:hypothetical protein